MSKGEGVEEGSKGGGMKVGGERKGLKGRGDWGEMKDLKKG